MGKQVKRICTICARGGSKGVPNKNIRSILGKPLLVHTIEQALESKLFDVIAVSSDAHMILDIARQAGLTELVQRPSDLATDKMGKLPVIQHCVRAIESRSKTQFDTIVDLDVTSPLRVVQDIIESVKLLERHGASNVITGSPARRSPYFNLVEADENGGVRPVKQLLNPIMRRQDSPDCYDMNASIYVWRREGLLKNKSVFNRGTKLYLMPEERSHDIDSEHDFELVEFLMKKRGQKGVSDA